MKEYRIFIDGAEGTTGLQLRRRLAARENITLLEISESGRKDAGERKKLMDRSDLVFLCLPDEAAREAAVTARDSDVKIIDASTAHRTSPLWQYGFPELDADFRENIIHGRRISVPGCHASGFVALVRPLVQAGILAADAALCCLSLTGYSGGGKQMIAEYENPARSAGYAAPQIYALQQQHKHLPEMAVYAGLSHPPVFCPVVADYYSGMVVSVPLHASQLKQAIPPDAIVTLYQETYSLASGLVQVLRYTGANGVSPANQLSGSDRMELSVEGNAERFTLTARFDNLGKGACGAAIQCMNLALGLPELEGLII